MPPAVSRAQAEEPRHYLDQAARCRRLAYSICDRQATAALLAMAEEFESSAVALRKR